MTTCLLTRLPLFQEPRNPQKQDLDRVAGVSDPGGSERAFDLFMKARYLHEETTLGTGSRSRPGGRSQTRWSSSTSSSYPIPRD